MSKSTQAIAALPSGAEASLRMLGRDLAIARKRRGEPLRQWAQRMQVSVPTLQRVEKGDPSVSMGVYATALWLIGRHDALAKAADPKEDVAALEAEIQLASRRGARREPIS